MLTAIFAGTFQTGSGLANSARVSSIASQHSQIIPVQIPGEVLAISVPAGETRVLKHFPGANAFSAQNMDRHEALSPRPPALANKKEGGRNLAPRSVQWRGFPFWVPSI
jgi:hypothetical protein